MTRPPALKRHRTLRWRLVAILAGLLAVTSLVIGIVTVLSLQSYLLGQVDQNLAQASQRAVDAKADLPPHSDQQPGTGTGTGSTGSTGSTGNTGNTGTDADHDGD
ncbi:MAG TPA: hypothetical protein VGI08_00370, partial [Diaminobutyricibacter sp.]